MLVGCQGSHGYIRILLDVWITGDLSSCFVADFFMIVNRSLPVSIQLCIALQYLATGSFQDMVGELHGVSQPTGRFRFSISLLIPLDPGLDPDRHYEANLYM